MASMIDVKKRLPKKWLSMTHKEILYDLKKPTLIKIKGSNQNRSIFISTLLHGNEPSGYLAIVNFIKDYLTKPVSYPFNILFLICNVDAAKEGPFKVRQTKTQVDYNRVWFCESLSKAQYKQAKEILEIIKAQNPIAHIDLHNTKGISPVYGIMMNRSKETVELANVFTDKHVYYENRVGALIMALEDICPSVAIECGKHFTKESNKTAKEAINSFIEYCTKKARGEIYQPKEHTVYTGQIHVKVKKDVSIKISDDITKADMVIPKMIDHFNFIDVPIGSTIAITKNTKLPIECIHKGKDVAKEFFEINCGRLMTKQPITIIMAKPHEADIKLESLFYMFTGKNSSQ